ncbi:MAG: substrate-binding domain-containing protein [Streptosporangiaceae bacterium]|nr:substrate-binding domain-containing protein [Streptosporangiaceae bacterium]
MHRLRKTAAGVAVAAAAMVAAAVPAFADPVGNNGKPVVPRSYDIVSVGANTDENLFNQLSVSYNSTHKAHNPQNPYIYTWNATPPGSTGTGPSQIVPKAGCTKITRPNGSGAGISALDNNQLDGKTGHFCIDLARSSSGRSPKDPQFGPGGIAFVALAKDAVTYATRDKASGGTNAPASLTTAQLTSIYLCKVTNWKQVGGKNGAIEPFLPQTGSGTRTFFLKAINVTAPGTCVNNALEENQGLSSQLNSANAIFIYSAGDYVAQVFHSAKCGKKPAAGQNAYGCDQHGVLGLDSINGTRPTVGTGANTTINPAFSAKFVRLLYDVVRFNTAANPIPGYEQKFFGRTGYLCTSPTAVKAIKNYGFLTTPLCGVAS